MLRETLGCHVEQWDWDWDWNWICMCLCQVPLARFLLAPFFGGIRTNCSWTCCCCWFIFFLVNDKLRLFSTDLLFFSLSLLSLSPFLRLPGYRSHSWRARSNRNCCASDHAGASSFNNNNNNYYFGVFEFVFCDSLPGMCLRRTRESTCGESSKKRTCGRFICIAC